MPSRCTQHSVYAAGGHKVDFRTQQVFTTHPGGWTRLPNAAALNALPAATPLLTVPLHASLDQALAATRYPDSTPGARLLATAPQAATGRTTTRPDPTALLDQGLLAHATALVLTPQGRLPDQGILTTFLAAATPAQRSHLIAFTPPSDIPALLPHLRPSEFATVFELHNRAGKDAFVVALGPTRATALAQSRDLRRDDYHFLLAHPTVRLDELDLADRDLPYTLLNPTVPTAMAERAYQVLLDDLSEATASAESWQITDVARSWHEGPGRILATAAAAHPVPDAAFTALVATPPPALTLGVARALATNPYLTDRQRSALTAYPDPRVRQPALLASSDPTHLTAAATDPDVLIRASLFTRASLPESVTVTLATDPDPTIAALFSDHYPTYQKPPPRPSTVAQTEFACTAAAYDDTALSISRRMQAQSLLDPAAAQAIETLAASTRVAQRANLFHPDAAVMARRDAQYEEYFTSTTRSMIHGSPERTPDPATTWDHVAVELSTWLEGNSGRGPDTALLQSVIADTAPTQIPTMSAPAPRGTDELTAFADEFGPVLHSWARAVRDETAQRYAAGAITHVSLTRGLTLTTDQARALGITPVTAQDLSRSPTELTVPIEATALAATLPGRAVASWSTSPSTAANFSRSGYSPQHLVHVVLHADHPVSRIWGTGDTGGVRPTEGEVLVYNTPGVYQAFAFTDETFTDETFTDARSDQTTELLASIFSTTDTGQ